MSAEISHILKQHATETLQQAESYKTAKAYSFSYCNYIITHACITFIFLYKKIIKKKKYTLKYNVN